MNVAAIATFDSAEREYNDAWNAPSSTRFRQRMSTGRSRSATGSVLTRPYPPFPMWFAGPLLV